MSDDILVGYPTADRAALRRAGRRRRLAGRDHAHGRQHGAARPHRRGRAARPAPAEMRVCLELDASWRPLARATSASAARRCTPRRLGALAARSPAAGFPAGRADVVRGADRRAGRRAAGPAGLRAAIRVMQRRSLPELLARARPRSPRSASTPTGVRQRRRHRQPGRHRGRPGGHRGHRRLRPVRADAVRRVPSWRPTPAAYFALSVVRRPGPRHRDRARRRLDRLRPGRDVPAAAARCCPRV